VYRNDIEVVIELGLPCTPIPPYFRFRNPKESQLALLRALLFFNCWFWVLYWYCLHYYCKKRS